MNLSQGLRDLILADPAITALLSPYNGSFAVFTRRPVPEDAKFPMIVISTDVTVNNEDGISYHGPVAVRDIMVYGLNENATQYRDIETLGYALRELFHRTTTPIPVDGYHVIDVQASGPRIAPADNDNEIGRMVELTIRMAKD